jgi:hypothetical protein
MRALEAFRQITSECWFAGETLRGILVPQTVTGQAERLS